MRIGLAAGGGVDMRAKFIVPVWEINPKFPEWGKVDDRDRCKLWACRELWRKIIL
jgi:hypothetical protein